MDNGLLALIGGIANGIGAARERNQQEEYKKAMMDHLKTQNKMAEQQLILKQMEQNLKGQQWEALQGVMQGQSPQMIPKSPIPQMMPQSGQPGNYGDIQKLLGGGVIPQSQAQAMAGPQPQPEQKPGLLGMIQRLMGNVPKPQASNATGMNPEFLNRFNAMNEEYKAKTGIPLEVTDSFRTYDQQADLYKRKPGLAAPPGKSLHEQGLAMDINSAQADELAKLGLLEKYGFQRPMLGQGKSGKNEPWHIEMNQNAPIKPAQYNPNQQTTPPMPGQPVSKSQGTKIDFSNPGVRALFKGVYGIDPKEQIDTRVVGGHLVTLKDGKVESVIQGPPNLERFKQKDPNSGAEQEYLMSVNKGWPGVLPGAGGPTMGGIMALPPGPTAAQEGKLQGTMDQSKLAFGPTGAQRGTIEGQTQVTKENITGQTPETAGKINLVSNALKRVSEANQILFNQDGSINRSIINQGAVGAGIGASRTFYSKMYQSIDAALRLETGAQANPSEIENKMREFWPSPLDNDDTVKNKMRDLSQYVGGLPEVMKTLNTQPAQKTGKQADPLGLR